MYRSTILCLVVIMVTGCTWRTLHYFPAITGTVTFENEPLSDVKIEYFSTTGFWPSDHNRVSIENYTTNENGQFIIPLNTRTGLVGPHVHRIETRILIYFDNKIYLGLRGVRDYMDNDQINISESIRLDCELSKASANNTINGLNGDRYTNEDSVEYTYDGICI